EAQLAPVYGIVARDIDEDGYLDLLLNGNEFSMAPSLGRNDALNGVVLMGKGKSFIALAPGKSGFYVGGNGKGLVDFMLNGNYAISAAQNFGPLKTFQLKQSSRAIALEPEDRIVTIQLANGQTRKQEVYWGSGFLSQSPNMVVLNKSITAVQVSNKKGEKRTLK
ncbi:MAG: RNA-binding protein, partial [Chitinophagaceae bacterium]|nr:RNA-binding protein [Chitinophagaceae bacterium]